MRHYNSVQNPTKFNIYAETLDSPSGEDQDMPSQSSRLIPEYANICISALRLIKIIQERYKHGYGIPKVFCLISIFEPVAMSVTKSILTGTDFFASKLLHREEMARSSPENLPNFTNPLVSNIEEVNDTFNFK